MRRLIAILLAILMVAQMMPVAVLAEAVQGDEKGFQSAESNDIEGGDVEEVFEITFELEDGAEQTPQPANGKGNGKGKLLYSKSNNGKGDEKSNGRSAEAHLRRHGEKVGILPDAPKKKHVYGWVDKKSKRYVTEDTVVTGNMTLSPVGTNEEDLSLSSGGVSVEVPEDSVPENTEFTAVAVSAASVQDAVESMVGEVSEIRAMEMTFTDRNIDQEVEPSKPVEVTMSVAGMDTDMLSVIHIMDDGSQENVPFTLNGNTVSFTAGSFSIYAVVEAVKIITVNFYDGEGNKITSEYIRKIDNEVQDLYTPGFDLEYGESFFGWKNDPAATTGLNIDEINAYIEQNWNDLNTDNPLEYYAIVKKVYVVTYNQYNEDGTLVVLDTVQVEIEDGSKTITIDSKPDTISEEDFEGWLGQDGLLYQPGSDFSVNGHFSFYLKAQGHYWLVFDSNAGGPGSGATYTPPQLIIGDAVTEEPDEPTRTGYTFLGWNTKANGSGQWWGTYYTVDATGNKTSHTGNKQFGGVLTEDVNLYAQWKGDLTTYYVLFWQQDVHDEANLSDSEKHYNYVGNRTVTTSRTGDEVSTTAADRGYADSETTLNGNKVTFYEYEYNARKSDTTAVVAADGTTTLNVYYDLKQYTLTFQSKLEVVKNDNDNSPQKYGDTDGNGRIQKIYWNYGKFRLTNDRNGTVYNGPVYKLGSNWKTIKEIKALAGHDISSEWPIAGSDGIKYGTGNRWDPQGNLSKRGQTYFRDNIVVVYVDVMTPGNMTLRWQDNSDNKAWRTMTYWIETLNGVPGSSDVTTKPFGDKLYEERKKITAWLGCFTDEDYIEIPGFSKAGADKYLAYGDQFGYEVYFDNPNNQNNVSTEINFFYSRNQYTLHFKSISDGAQYIDENVYYEQPLSEYASVTPTNGADGYAFIGWYTDESCAPGTEFDFNTTMPYNDITLYAKWETQRARVVLIPNAPEGEYSFANNQSLSFRLDYNEKANGANITGTAAKRTGYTLIGWYVTVNGEDLLWNFETQVNKSVPGVNPNYQSTADWTNNTYGDNDGKHDNVVNILKLKAKWKLNVDDNSVYVVYQVPDAYIVTNASGDMQTIIPVDDTAYFLPKDATSVTFQTAPAPTDYNDGYVFKDWALLGANGAKTGITYKDGSGAEVDESNFKTVTISDDEGTTKTIRYIYLEAEFEPYEDRATVVIYNGQGGTTGDGKTTVEESYLVNKSFNIIDNPFTREGYRFVGWNTSADGTGETLAAGDTVAADNLTGSGWNGDANQNIESYAVKGGLTPT